MTRQERIEIDKHIHPYSLEVVGEKKQKGH